MIIKLKYYGEEVEKTHLGWKFFPITKTFEISTEEAEGLWVSLNLGDHKEISEEEFKNRLEAELNHLIYNETEYNPLRKDHDKQDFYFSVYKGDGENDGIQTIGVYDPKYDYQKIDHLQKMEDLVREVLKKHPDWAEIVIAKDLHDQTLRQYAQLHGLNEKSVSRKYCSAKEKLKKYFQDPRTYRQMVAD